MNTNPTKTINVKVRRGTKEEKRYSNYIIDDVETQSVLNVLNYIVEMLDPTLAFTRSCRIGCCTACLVKVNGQTIMACTTLVEGDMTIEPYNEEKMVRDLVAELPDVIATKKLDDLVSCCH